MLTVVGQVFTQAVDLGHWQGTETGTTVGHHSEREGWRGREGLREREIEGGREG